MNTTYRATDPQSIIPPKRPIWHTRKWGEFNQRLYEQIISTGIGVSDLPKLSPELAPPGDPWTAYLIDRLFPENPLLCIGQKHFCFNQRKEKWLASPKLPQWQFMVPSPMLRKHGRTTLGKAGSARALSNVADRTYLVIEFDQAPLDHQAALLVHFAVTNAPLCLAVHSGSKSIHGWFCCRGISDAQVFAFMRHAVSLGADPATWTKNQMVRLPDGTRNDGKRKRPETYLKRQQVLFFNPEAIR